MMDNATLQPLTCPLELANVLSLLGDDYTRKGFFFHRHVRAIGERFEAVRATLEAPPKLGMYFPFQDYPTRDYMRVFHAATVHRFPGLPAAQAHRLLAHEELGSYLELAVGRVTFGMFSDPLAFLLAFQDISRRLMSRPIGRAEKLGDCHVRITYDDPIGSLPYALGALEGIVMAFKLHPRITVSSVAEKTVFDVKWGV